MKTRRNRSGIRIRGRQQKLYSAAKWRLNRAHQLISNKLTKRDKYGMSNKEKEDGEEKQPYMLEDMYTYFSLAYLKTFFVFFCFLLFIKVERKVEGSEEGKGSEPRL